MRTITTSEYTLIAGGYVAQAEAVYTYSVLGTGIGFAAGVSALCAIGLSPVGMVAAAAAGGAASTYMFSSNYLGMGAGVGACSGLGAVLAMSTGSANAVLCSAILGGIIGMNVYAAIS